MFVGAHPDDLEFGCAGTIKWLVDNGHNALCVVVTDGGRGGDKEARAREQAAASGVLGCSLMMLGKEDLTVKADKETVTEIARIVKDFAPDAVLTHGKHDRHPDHIATTQAVEAAVQDCISKGIECRLLYYKSYSSTEFAPAIAFSHGHGETKEKALLCHESQISKYRERGIDFVQLSGLQTESYEL